MISLFSKFFIETLKFLPRHQKGVLKLGKYSVEYIDSLSMYHEFKDIFEKQIYYFDSKKISPLIIDAGGYIGLSVLYFKSIYPQAHITVFEPDPNIFLVLKRNIEANNLKAVKLINAGLGKINISTDFYPDHSDGGSIFKTNTNNKTTKIYVVKLSSFINQPVDLLKMNIEGAEGDVFEEIENKLHFIKEIIFEYHAFHNLTQNLGKILTILDRNSFRYLITNAVGNKINIPFHLPKKYQYFNLIYAKQI